MLVSRDPETKAANEIQILRRHKKTHGPGDKFLSELGMKLTRILQNKNPESGADMETTKERKP